jgi:two-component system response regulator
MNLMDAIRGDKAILLVEDNPDDEKLTLRAFRKKNVVNPVVVARNGVEAADYLFGTGAHAGRNVSDTPAVILLDLKMPKLDGLGLLRRVRADSRTKHVPVVVLTSSIEQQDLISSYDLGANSYIRKPVDFEKFVEVAGTLGLYWLLCNQPPPAAREA